MVSLLDDPRSPADREYFGARGRTYQACGGNRRVLVRRVLQALRRETYDVVLAGHVNLAPLLMCAAAGRGRAKRVTMIYGVDAWIRLPLLRRLALQHSHRVLAISGYTARETARHNQLNGTGSTSPMVASIRPFSARRPRKRPRGPQRRTDMPC